MTSPTKYDQILEYVRNRIISGEFVPGDRLPSDGQLLRMFSTSRPTVAKAMHDLEKEGYLERRAGSGSFVCFTKETQPILIGMLIPERATAELFDPISAEISTHCKKHNLGLLRTATGTFDIKDDSEREKRAHELCQSYIEKGVRGVFFAPEEFSEHMRKVNRNLAQRLADAGISIVLLDRDLERLPNRSRYDLVGVDNFRVGLLQTNHFIQMGETRIAYVTRSYSAPTIDLRIAGYCHAIRKSKNDAISPLVLDGSADDGNFLDQIIASADALVCSNDMTAVMLLNALQARGIDVPEKMKLIGVDDVKIAESASVPLTTVRQPCREIGATAVRVMIERIEKRNMVASNKSLDVSLVVRESCGSAGRG